MPRGEFGPRTFILAGLAKSRQQAPDRCVVTPEKLAALLSAAGKFCPHGMYTDVEGLAFLLEVTPRTLADWRAAGHGPAWVKLKRIRYDLVDVATWWAENKVRETMKNDEVCGRSYVDAAARAE